jgi:chlorophyll(ide) b reductase
MLRQLNFRTELRKERAKKKQLNIVITGGSKGLGKGLLNEFIKRGDNVYSISRSENYDIGKIDDIIKVTNDILQKFDNRIDVWINNAGISGGFKSFESMHYNEIHDIISTNLLGTCVACNIAYDIMSKQNTGGAIFNLAGAGSDGRAIENYAVYGATKSGIVQFSKTLQKEWKASSVDIHVISPGMMLTDLLLSGMSIDLFNFVKNICTHPEIVAQELTPRIRNAYFEEEESYINYLTIPKILQKIIPMIVCFLK